MVGCGRSILSRPRAAAAVVVIMVAGLLGSCSLVPIGPGRPNPTPTSSSPVGSASPTAQPETGRPIKSPPQVRPNGFAEPPSGKGLDRYRGQRLKWAPCGSNKDDPLQCATVLVPLDYKQPDKTAITLSMARRPAKVQPKLGTLFINPGGPGASGVDYVNYFDRSGLDAYDIVGWDPRGVARSTPVTCFAGEQMDVYTEMDMSPDNDQEDRALQDSNRKFGESCLQQSGALLQHVSTEETVRDLDLLRHLVGDRKLNYFGASYGTEIGAYYAHFFPGRAGRLVLDGAVSLTPDDEISQAQGFERALADFADWCVKESCRLGDSQQEVLSAITDLWDSLDSSPLEVGNRVLTQTLGVTAVIQVLYDDEEGWRLLAQALLLAITEDNGQGLLYFADQYNVRDDQGTFGQLNYGFPAVRCLDNADEGIAEAKQDAIDDARMAPVIGPYIGLDYTCPLWPVKAHKPPKKITGEGTPPIIVIGNTGDSATPYEYAVDMADQLESGVLITYRGHGHLSYRRSACVRELVIGYLTKEKVPKDGAKC
jgi:pimeloyl-ACP methyl ester carboxylesterase